MTPFEEFQKDEYGKIAEAHFKTTESISAFFRYYLLLMALPLSLVGAFVALGARASTPLDALEQLFSSAKFSLGFVFLVIGLVGLFLMAYISNLRFDALLYARSVNAIRKFFYDKADEGFLYKARLRILPQNAFEPNYFEWFFIPVVAVFALFNSLYALLGWMFIVDQSKTLLPSAATLEASAYAYVAVPAFAGLHFLWYWCGARLRETSYLQRGSMGVDIDGVLNRHREHFAFLLKKQGGPTIDPSAIHALPVRECGLGVTKEHEINVFNAPEYWLDMPADPTAAHFLSALRDQGLKIHVVTNRPWPAVSGLDAPSQETLRATWRSAAQGAIKSCAALERLMFRLRTYSRTTNPAIQVITKDWLRRNEIPFDTLTIERRSGRGGVYHSRSTGSRVQIARKRALKFFVEDDREAAHRLAFICDVVFLIRHPYNHGLSRDPFGKQPFTEELPSNVVMVTDWSEIYAAIKQLM